MSSTSYDIVDRFEKTIAEYAGSSYGVAVESCTAALFLSLLYYRESELGPYCGTIPKFTYPGVACSLINAQFSVDFNDIDWEGCYPLAPYEIYDSALRFKRGMYKRGLYCLSFHAKKHLPIGRGGMILTDSFIAYKWLRKARFDGRSEVPLSEDEIDMVGWNMYMTPEQAARGLMLFDLVKNKKLPDIDWRTQGYPDLSKIEAYK